MEHREQRLPGCRVGQPGAPVGLRDHQRLSRMDVRQVRRGLGGDDAEVVGDGPIAQVPASIEPREEEHLLVGPLEIVRGPLVPLLLRLIPAARGYEAAMGLEGGAEEGFLGDGLGARVDLRFHAGFGPTWQEAEAGVLAVDREADAEPVTAVDRDHDVSFRLDNNSQ